MQNFLFRKMDNAEQLVRQYQEFFDVHQSDQPVNAIHRTFYSGLVALYCLRQTQDQYWMRIALKASKAFDAWAEGCKWNFENMALLIKAEISYSLGDHDKAAKEYQLSIASAHDHRFVHEEAIANELAAYFHLEQGRKDLANGMMQRSMECYQSWGATKKADALLQVMRRL